VTPIKWVPRPKMYSLKHPDGVSMKQTGNWLCYSGWSTCVYSDCMYWATGDQCAFCNSNAQYEGGKGQYEKTWVHKTPDQMGEAAAAAIASGCNSLLLSCGTRSENFLVGLWTSMLKAMREHTGIELPFVNLNPPALKNLENIDRLFEAGARALVIDQEVWDPNSFKSICPGKSKTIGREAWMKAIEYAAEKYTRPEKGKVAVCCALVLGLEEKSKYIEAVNYYADRNIPVHLPPWKVLKGSNLYGHRSPHAWWTMDVMDEAMEIQMKKMPWIATLDAWRQSFQHSYNGAQTVLYWDWIRRALIEKGLIRIEDQQLQDWQLAGVNWNHIDKILRDKKIITKEEPHVKDWKRHIKY